MKTLAYVYSSNMVLAWALENVDLKRVMSTTASIATLTWRDLEPNMLDEQFFVPMANLIPCFKLNFALLLRNLFETVPRSLLFTHIFSE